jgi:hypothetical protein
VSLSLFYWKGYHLSKIKLIDFLEDIKENCSNITYLSAHHVFKKVHKEFDDVIVERTELLEVIANYPMLMRYLNDFAGPIYRHHNSSVEEIYTELCNYFGINMDNEYTFGHILKKLEKQTPALLMSLTDEDIQQQTVENFEEKLELIRNSNYYQEHKLEVEEKVNKLQNNIDLVKKALNYE